MLVESLFIFAGHYMGGHVNTVFTLTTILFTICVMLSITTFREVPLKMLNKVELQYREVRNFFPYLK